MTLTTNPPGMPQTQDFAAGIKSIEYMRHQSARALATPADQSSFRAFDLNQPQDPGGQLLVVGPGLADLRSRGTAGSPGADGPG